ncbi:MAG: glutaminyl-peptide cyclotransferase [Bacteroidales bacterium]
MQKIIHHIYGILIIGIVSLCSCTNTTDKTEQYSVSIEGNTSLVQSHSTLHCKYASDNVIPDSVQILLNGTITETIHHPEKNFNCHIPDTILGRQSISFRIFTEEHTETHNMYITVVSDKHITPVYPEVITSYNHDRNAYTQGLEWHNGVLYESTGQYGESSIRIVELESGRIIKKHALSDSYFGEGLTRIGDSLLQITWKSQKGFIYKTDNLKKIGEFTYDTEGWGLCNDGTYVYMSDGSEFLYVYTLPHMQKIKQFAVYDHVGAVSYLNELEYINGLIYANIYQSNDIVAIDPTSGKVQKRLNLDGLLPEQEKDETTDVLNGIAYDSKNNRIFVTGKYWPQLFEISF